MEHLEIKQLSETQYPINIAWDNCGAAIEPLSDIPGIDILENNNPNDVAYIIYIRNRKVAYEAILALNKKISQEITHYKDRGFLEGYFYGDGIQDIWDAQDLVNAIMQYDSKAYE